MVIDVNGLQAELTARGLTTRATAKKPAKELHVSLLQRILVRAYYMGVVEYRGVQYEGSHTLLITPEIFFKVQEVLAAHNTAGERSWRHQHYLKGSVFCSDCDSRLTLDFASGHGGRYAYFVCLGRKRGVECKQKALQTDAGRAGVGAALAPRQGEGLGKGGHPASPDGGPGR